MKEFSTILLFLILFLPFLSSSQGNPVVSTETTVVGEDFSTGEEISAKRIHFQIPIQHTYVDSLEETLTLELREVTKNKKYYKRGGAIAHYDLKRNKMLWSKDVNYNNTQYAHMNGLMIQTKGKKSICIDVKTGREKWELRNKIAHVFPGTEVAMGYRSQGAKDKFLALQGVNLDNGEIIWERKIDRTFGWREMLNLNDSTVLISSSGIHSVNFKNGKGWSHNEVVGKNKNNFWTGRDILMNICSNIALDSTSIYFASSNTIASYNHDGSERWNQPLNMESTSKSQLFFFGEENLVFVNLGMANSAMSYEKRYGHPYVSIYNRNTGERLHYLDLHSDKDYIRRLTRVRDVLFLQFEDKIVTVDLTTGQMLAANSPQNKIKQEILYPLNKWTYYEMEQDSILPLYRIDTTSTFYSCEGGLIIGINEKAEMSKVLKFDKLYGFLGFHDGLIYVTNGKKGYAINEFNEILFEFESGWRGIIVNDTLYTFHEKYLQILDLATIKEASG